MTVKNKILQEVLTQVRAEYQSLAKALADSSAAATDPGSKAECKYDTRSLEMSYLAAGQSRQAETLQEGLLQLEDFNLRDFAVTDRIGLGALVEVEQEGVWESYLLLPAGGGLTVDSEGVSVTILTPESPLFSQLDGRRIGEQLAAGESISEIA